MIIINDMKKYIIFFIIFVGITYINAQTTPNGTDISTYIVNYPPLTPAEIAWVHSQIDSLYPNVIKVDEPTSDYNCHNYAFVKSEGGSEFWLKTPGDDQFWLDGSFLRVNNIGTENIKISYHGDHSAVMTNNSSKAISKWGKWGLYEHLINDVPSIYLPGSSKEYYFRSSDMSMTGDITLCTSNKTYSIVGFPSGSGLTVSWSVSPTSLFSIDNGSGTSFTTKASSSSSSGEGTITATITDIDGNENDYTKTVWVGKPNGLPAPPVFMFSPSPTEACIDETSSMTTGPNLSYDQYFTWDFGSWGSYVSGYSGVDNKLVDFYFDHSTPSSNTIKVSKQNSCGTGPQRSGSFTVIDCYSYFVVSPNPANNFVNVSVDELKNQNGDTKIYAIDVYDRFRGKQISKTYSTGTIEDNIDLSNLITGIYTISIFDGKQWYSHQLAKE